MACHYLIASPNQEGTASRTPTTGVDRVTIVKNWKLQHIFANQRELFLAGFSLFGVEGLSHDARTLSPNPQSL